MTVTITNKGNSTAKLLNNPDGTLSTLPTNAFKITHDETGEEPEFYGVVVSFLFFFFFRRVDVSSSRPGAGEVRPGNCGQNWQGGRLYHA